MNISTKGKKLIGRGAFSKVWDNGDGTVTIKSKDYAKECMALFIDSDRFPKIECIDCDCDNGSTYIMPKYNKVKAIKRDLSAHDYGLYTYLRKVVSIENHNMHNYYKLFDLFSSMPEQYANERAQLLDALGELANYGQDICFEISPRNVFIVNGKLIFADVFFFRSQSREVKRAA
jgi:hypothetical protein